MKTPPSPEVSDLLIAWGNGDAEALHKLIPLVHHELHRLAATYMRRESPGHTLETSALVNEAYLKLIDQKRVHWKNRAHFFGVAAQLMRRILVDHARTRTRAKRGGGLKLTLDEAVIPSLEDAEEFLVIDEALTNLSTIDPRKSRIVEMKIFCGLTTEEIAEVEKVSVATVHREWRRAKAWLRREIET
jgi:RNA polymerase sigma factor (TIGR02999 family)